MSPEVRRLFQSLIQKILAQPIAQGALKAGKKKEMKCVDFPSLSVSVSVSLSLSLSLFLCLTSSLSLSLPLIPVFSLAR
jgi:hypothetical protein